MLFSIVVPVRNEEANLPLCLERLKEFDDVIVVDSGSTDGTVGIAQSFGRNVLNFVWNGGFPKKRNWVLRNYPFKYPWVLFLDADERIPPEFKREVGTITQSSSHNGFWIGYSNWFMGRLLKHGDPVRKLSLLRVGCGEFERIAEESWSKLDMEVHEHLVVSGTVGAITARIDHHDMRTLDAYYERHNEYSSWEAMRYLKLKGMISLTFRQKLKYRMIRWKIFPPIYFIANYFLRLGFLDGLPGFYFAISKMFYFYQIQAKVSWAELKINSRIIS